jgi:hypothetical protein
MRDKLSYRHQRNKTFLNSISDIYDGKVYKKFNEKFGDEWHKVTFTLFSDGAPLIESSSQSIWPVLLSINELEPKLR